jgi:thioredoxin-related protein
MFRTKIQNNSFIGYMPGYIPGVVFLMLLSTVSYGLDSQLDMKRIQQEAPSGYDYYYVWAVDLGNL